MKNSASAKIFHVSHLKKKYFQGSNSFILVIPKYDHSLERNVKEYHLFDTKVMTGNMTSVCCLNIQCTELCASLSLTFISTHPQQNFEAPFTNNNNIIMSQNIKTIRD
jgi:hypothetical protein